MSKDFPQFSEDEVVKPEEPAKPKRLSAPRSRKTASARKPKKTEEPEEKQNEIVVAPVAEAKMSPMVEEKIAPEISPVIEPDWAEAVPESVGGVTTGGEGGHKRKRRRRKGKSGVASAPVAGLEVSTSLVPSAPVPPPQQPPKPRLDPESLAKAAWKIYLAEVSEEGVALVGDQDARDLARRCFRLAEIFMEERGRRCGL